ncbi:DNA recombination-mediator protein A [Ruminococcaceae bacterium YAD3003]|nr:DNA recombination-mediator protein A [Ruminococcaceae bacterium YAD3003]
MNETVDHFKDFFYSAVRLNTEINYKTINELICSKAIGSYRELADMEQLKRIVGGSCELSDETTTRINQLIDSYSKIQTIANEYKKIADTNGISVVSCEDDNYPYNWKVQTGMPKVFYFSGNYSLLDQMVLKGSIAVVGSRNPSKYALYATEKFCSELGNKGITTVSGMARGIDRQAHLASVKTAGGTIAILAGGVDNIYPPDNKDLYNTIKQGGLILSEMPPGQQPLRQYFPSRNRLIAGLTDCTLIMEAGSCSGTLHTASFAANQGKEIFVLPNNIYYENAKGGLKLLEDGCNVLVSTDSVVDSISQALMYKRMTMGNKEDIYFDDKTETDTEDVGIDMLRTLAKEKPEELDDDKWKLLIKDMLTLNPLSADDINSAIQIPFYKLSKLLTDMELNGTVCQEKGKYSLTFV